MNPRQQETFVHYISRARGQVAEKAERYQRELAAIDAALTTYSDNRTSDDVMAMIRNHPGSNMDTLCDLFCVPRGDRVNRNRLRSQVEFLKRKGSIVREGTRYRPA
jgi:hypothetical protein